MPPLRRERSSKPSSSEPLDAHHKRFKSRPQHKDSPAPDALPGVQKIKAALRQTRRLLAKDSLAADVRVASERRLRSLEGDLAKAEQARLERTMAMRYHKIKFFERQKVTRKIGQTKKHLAGTTGQKERKALEAQLGELRIDLNYVLHYPKTKKYIALFPPEMRQGQDALQTAKEETEKTETDRQREEVRDWVRAQMESGALSLDPEGQLDRPDRKGAAIVKRPSTHAGKANSWEAGDENSKPSEKRSRGGGVAEDEFFAMDDDDDVVGESGGHETEDNDSLGDSEIDSD